MNLKKKFWINIKLRYLKKAPDGTKLSGAFLDAFLKNSIKKTLSSYL